MTQLPLLPLTQAKKLPNPPPATPQPLCPDTLAQAAAELQQFIENESAEYLRESIQEFVPIKYEDHGDRRTLSYLCLAGQPPIFQVIRQPDGTVTTLHNGQEMNLPLQAPPCEGEIKRMVGSRLMAQALQSLGVRMTAMATLPGHPNGYMNHGDNNWIAASTIAAATIEAQTVPSVLPGTYREPEPNARRGLDAQRRLTFDQILRQYLLDKRIVSEARRTTRRKAGQPVHASEYNSQLNQQPHQVRCYYQQPRHQIPPDQLNQALREASPHIQRWRPIHYRTDDDTVILDVMDDGVNAPIASFKRHPNGYIETDHRLPRHEIHRLNYNNVAFHHEAIEQARLELFTALLANSPDPGGLLFSGNMFDNRKLISDESIQLVQQSLLPPIMPPKSRTKSIDLETLSKTVTRLVRTKVAEPHRIKAADRHPGWQICQYNNLALNQDLFSAIQDSEPSVFAYYMETMFQREEQPHAFENAAAMVAEVQEHLQMSKGPWRWFIRLAGQWDAFCRGGDNMRSVCQAIHEANVPAPDRDHLITVTKMATDIKLFLQRANENGQKARWQNMTRALNRFLSRNEPFDQAAARDLRHVIDALRLPQVNHWGPGDWNTMVARADRLLVRSRDPQQRSLSWTSAIPAQTIGDYILTPQLDSAALRHCAQVMTNCLASYDLRCANGNEQIFLIEQPGQDKPIGAVQLSSYGGHWRITQIEGPERSAVPAAAKAACRNLVEIYERADTAGDFDDD